MRRWARFFLPGERRAGSRVSMASITGNVYP
jgi:hypothetical protein